MSEPVIEVRDLGKAYRVYDRPEHRLLEALSPRRRQYHREFWALRNVALEVQAGETVGIVGRNGSGKSTLLQMIAGTLTPTEGSVTTRGRIASLLELGAGFNPECTGRENVFLYGAFLGVGRGEMQRRFETIAAFADIGPHLDQPVKTYSSGMYVRLAFSVAINTEPDLLIIDEALAVGDALFQQKCMNKLRRFREQGVAILFVTHDFEAVRRLCTRAVVLHEGQVINCGPAVETCDWYLAFLANDCDLAKTRTRFESVGDDVVPARQSEPKKPCDGAAAEPEHTGEAAPLAGTWGDASAKPRHDGFKPLRHGDGLGRIRSAAAVDVQGRPVESVRIGDLLTLQVEAEFHTELEHHVFGCYVRDSLGTNVIGINTYQERVEIPTVQPGDRLIYTLAFEVDLKPGHYGLSFGLAYGQSKWDWMDSFDNCLIVQVVDPVPERAIFGMYRPRGIALTAQNQNDTGRSAA